MKFWKRQATLQIGSKRFGMDDLYFKFTVPFEDSEKLGTATIEEHTFKHAFRFQIGNREMIPRFIQPSTMLHLICF